MSTSRPPARGGGDLDDPERPSDAAAAFPTAPATLKVGLLEISAAALVAGIAQAPWEF